MSAPITEASLRAYARQLVVSATEDIEFLTVVECAEDEFDRELTDEEAREVADLAQKAKVVVYLPDDEGYEGV